MSATFTFRAVDAAGGNVIGELDSESREGVIESLRERGLLALEVKQKVKAVELSLDRFARVGGEEVALLTRQLSTMINAGLSLMRALTVLEDQTENPKLKLALIDIRDRIQAGLSFSDAIAKHPKIFDELFVAMIRAGETGGFLEDVLKRVADQLEASVRLKRQVRGAMVYPAVVLSVALVVVVAMLTFIIPVFAKVFTQFGGKLPFITSSLITLSHIMKNEWYIPLFGLIALVVGFRKWKASDVGRPMWDRIRLRAPVKIGSVVLKVGMARWARTMASLTTAGVPMLEAIEVTGRTAGNTMIERAMDSVHESVQTGGTIAGALAGEAVFPSLITNMVRVGEETGELDTTLTKVAEFYEEQVDVAVKSLTSILEPVMIVVIGSIVGFMIIAMYLPMFDLYNQIH